MSDLREIGSLVTDVWVIIYLMGFGSETKQIITFIQYLFFLSQCSIIVSFSHFIIIKSMNIFTDDSLISLLKLPKKIKVKKGLLYFKYL